MMKFVISETYSGKVDGLSMAIFRASQAIRLCVKEKKENDLRNSKYDLNNPLTTFNYEVEYIRRECPDIQIPKKMTDRIKRCQAQLPDWGALCPQIQACIDDFSRQSGDGTDDDKLAKWDRQLNSEAKRLGLPGTAHAHAISSWWASVQTIRYCRTNSVQDCRAAVESAEKHIREQEAELSKFCPNLKFPQP